jgi:hypothetical protein
MEIQIKKYTNINKMAENKKKDYIEILTITA